MLFGIPKEIFVYLVLFFTLLPIIVLSTMIKSSYFKISFQKKLWIILLTPILTTGILILIASAITMFLRSFSSASSVNMYAFLGMCLLILFLLVAPLYLLVYISKVIWTKKHPDYAIIKLEKKTHWPKREGVLFLSIDEKPFGKSDDSFHLLEQILITSGEHKVEFSKFSQNTIERINPYYEDFREEISFHFKKNTTYLVTFKEKGKLKTFNIQELS